MQWKADKLKLLLIKRFSYHFYYIQKLKTRKVITLQLELQQIFQMVSVFYRRQCWLEMDLVSTIAVESERLASYISLGKQALLEESRTLIINQMEIQ